MGLPMKSQDGSYSAVYVSIHSPIPQWVTKITRIVFLVSIEIQFIATRRTVDSGLCRTFTTTKR